MKQLIEAINSHIHKLETDTAYYGSFEAENVLYWIYELLGAFGCDINADKRFDEEYMLKATEVEQMQFILTNIIPSLHK